MYIKAWDDFQTATEALYAKSPAKTRYCVKWKSSKGELVLKITDDVTCLKYKSHSSIILHRFDALNLSLMRKMQNSTAPPEPAAAAPTPAAPALTGDGASSAVVAGAAAAATQDGAAGGVKKKKPKKKK